jgi:hypothetical protein
MGARQFQPETLLTAALPVLTSISNSARRWAPSASRFVEVRVFFEGTS